VPRKRSRNRRGSDAVSPHARETGRALPDAPHDDSAAQPALADRRPDPEHVAHHAGSDRAGLGSDVERSASRTVDMRGSRARTISRGCCFLGCRTRGQAWTSSGLGPLAVRCADRGNERGSRARTLSQKTCGVLLYRMPCSGSGVDFFGATTRARQSHAGERAPKSTGLTPSGRGRASSMLARPPSLWRAVRRDAREMLASLPSVSDSKRCGTRGLVLRIS